MRPRSIKSDFYIFKITGLLCLLVTAACQEVPSAETRDYRVDHKISAEEKAFTLNLSVSGRDQAFEARDEARLRQFAREYMRRGRGPFFITGAENDQASSRGVLNKVAAMVVAEGVPADRVYFKLRRGANASSGSARLSFAGYSVRLPKCGDWSGGTGFVPSNQSHSDFGCSYQRNIGLMLANPADLGVAREAPYGDAPRTDYIVKTYRSGTETHGRPIPKNEQKEFSDVQ